jgi:hypothetical protein
VRRTIPALIVGLLLGVVAVPAAAQDDTVDRIDLPNGWRPEGITTDGQSLYVGSLGDGAIWVVDPVNDPEGRLFASGENGLVTVGVEASPDGATIWAAGGRTGVNRAYDVATGLPTTWTQEDGFGFHNDLAASDDGVYLTDSFVPRLLWMPPPVDGQANNWQPIRYSGDLVYKDGAFNVNGIAAAPGGLIVIQSDPGALFRVDPDSGETFAIDSGDVELSGGDGLELDGNILYVVRNSADVVTVLELDEDLANATLITELRHDDLDTPTTAALIGDDLWVVNARFGATAGPDTEYWLTRLDRVETAEG